MPPSVDWYECSKCHQVCYLACVHEWTGKRQGGDPAELSSYEWVEYCNKCGIERMEYMDAAPTPEAPTPQGTGGEEWWQKETINVISEHEGMGDADYTLAQLFNDYEAGLAAGFDKGLPYKQHAQAVGWLRKHLVRLARRLVVKSYSRGFLSGKEAGIREAMEKVEKYTDTEGCQAGSESCGIKNDGKFICEHCERWGGAEGKPKYHKRLTVPAGVILAALRSLLPPKEES